MIGYLFDLGNAQQACHADLAGLQACLTQLIGEPFRLARISYGDELTLHFGELRLAQSPKFKDKPYGSYILGVRGSSWILKSGCKPWVLTGGVLDIESCGIGKPLTKEELEAAPLIEPESRVLAATPFVVRPVDSFGMQLRMSDGSALLILPTLPEPEEPGDEALPELADWELLGPQGLLSAGPGLKWSYNPSPKPVPNSPR
jgi:hypothetical protein